MADSADAAQIAARSPAAGPATRRSRSPRLPVAKAWISSMTTVLRPGEQRDAVLVAEQQAQRFGRGQQHLRRPHALPRLAVGGRVAGAGLDPDRQAHLLDRRQQVALHVDRQRLERRDVERVQPVGRRLDQLGQGRQEAGQRLARPGRRDQQRAAPGARRGQHLELVPARRPALGREPVGDRAAANRAQWLGAPDRLFPRQSGRLRHGRS